MQLELRMRPSGPWRTGEGSGDRDRVDAIYHSDALYSAVTHAMKALGCLNEWLEATAQGTAGSAVRFSSLFPFAGPVRLAPPPRNAWPPAAPSRLFLEGARLVPLEVIFAGLDDDSRWRMDGASGCLLPADSAAPFSLSLRPGAAVDRISGQVLPHRTACLEFAPDAGWWGLVEIDNPAWETRVLTALRLLGDSGFGGERSLGWGRATDIELTDAGLLFGEATTADSWWLLSLYSPHEDDQVDWPRGRFTTIERGGWVENARKKRVRMIGEGSVLSAPVLRGRAVDVAPEGFPHPAWRAGFAVAVPAPTGSVL